MLNKLFSLIGISISPSGGGVVPACSILSSPAQSFPTAGLVLSTTCGGSDTSNKDNIQTTNDALGTPYWGSYYKWNELADGAGGSYWEMQGNAMAGAEPCYYPYGFVTSGYSNNPELTWNYGGSSGQYAWGNVWDVQYSDGNGGTLYDSGTYEFNGNGYTIPTGFNWAEGSIRYVSVGSWAFWYNYGYQLAYGWDNVYTDWGCGNVTLYQYEYYDYADGAGGSYRSWTGMYQFIQSGTFLQECNGNNYYADGNGSYYSESTGGGGGNEYPSYGTWLNSGSGTNYINVGCGDWSNGGYDWTEYADGAGGSYSEGNNSYESYGTYLGNCNGNNYYSNGSGDYYSEGDGSGGGNGCDSYGTWITGAQSGQNYINVGCGDWQVGDYSYDVYADGNCGTYTQTNWQNWYSYGTYLGNCNANNYYSDGYGSYYYEGDGSGSGDGGGGGCDPYGNYIGSGSYSNTYFINPALNPEIGTTSYDTVTDGNCGTTDINHSTTWYSFGTYIGTSDVIDPYVGQIQLLWHSDGAGGVYATLN